MPTLLTLDQIEAQIRAHIGDTGATDPDYNDTILDQLINQYQQRLPMRCAEVAAAAGVLPAGSTIHFDMWLTTTTSTTSAGNNNFLVVSGTQLFHLPQNFDHLVSFYDVTEKQPIEVIRAPKRFDSRLREKPAGPIEAIDLQGFATSTVWRRTGRFWPTPVGVPNVELEYYRLPADMAAGGNSPDIDYKYQMLLVWGPLLDVLRPDDPSYERVLEMERSLLLQLAHTARAV